MEVTNLFLAVLATILLGILEVKSTGETNSNKSIVDPTTELPVVQEFNPKNFIVYENESEDLDPPHPGGRLSRVKRQFGYDPYYGRRRYYPYPLPIFVGGGFGIGPGFGRGFGGRGFGGRGFGGGGRGFGGRGIGGRGFGGRGIGGGRGGIGGRGGGGGHGGGGRG